MTAVTADTDSSADPELCHGYTLSEINRLASVAVWRDVWHQSLPLPDRHDIAWSAVAEYLYASDHKPTSGELIRAAWSALRAETEAEWHTHGVSRTGSVFDGDQAMPQFARYWFTFARSTRDPEEPIIERIALHQIWEALPEKHQVLIAALAAAALGRPRQSFVSMLAEARKAFRELWHEGELPPATGAPTAAATQTPPTTTPTQPKRRRDDPTPQPQQTRRHPRVTGPSPPPGRCANPPRSARRPTAAPRCATAPGTVEDDAPRPERPVS